MDRGNGCVKWAYAMISLWWGCDEMVPADGGDVFSSILGPLRTRLRIFRVIGSKQREISRRMCYFWKSAYLVCGDQVPSNLVLWCRSSACKSWSTCGRWIVITWGGLEFFSLVYCTSVFWSILTKISSIDFELSKCPGLTKKSQS